MKEIVLKAQVGNEVKEVILQKPSGAGSYHIMIDKRYYGAVVPCLHNEWRVALQHENKPEWMTEDDKEVLVQAVKKVNGEGA